MHTSKKSTNIKLLRSTLATLALTIALLIAPFGCQSKSANQANNNEKAEKPIISNAVPAIIPPANNSVVDFCIENSGSMFGYVSSPDKFTQVVSILAADLDLNCERINYSMRNGTNTPIGNSLTDLGSFLTVNGMNQGNVTTSDINLMLNETLGKAISGNVAVLISDGIYSVPGDANTMLASLSTLSMATRNNFVRALKQANLITYMVKLNSKFEGKFFPASGGIKVINQQRPYYVWIIGNANQLQELFPNNYFEKLPGFEDIVKFIKLDIQQPNCCLIRYKPIGSSRYSLDLELTDVSPRKSEFSFSTAFDFSKHLLPLGYFDDSSVYQNNLGYQVTSVVRYETLTQADKASVQQPIKDKGASHVVTFQKQGAPWGTLNISIENKKPAWIDASSNINDEEPDTTTTFGLSYLIKGISDAYKLVNNTPYLAEYKISIKQ